MANSDDLHKFDWKIYVKCNPDLLLSNINTKPLATAHYDSIGKTENRKYCISDVVPIGFDWDAYRESKPHLNAFTKKQIALHYIEQERRLKTIINAPLINVPITSKDTFRKECTKQLPLLKHIELQSIPINCAFEIVFVEFRWYEHIELLLRNAILKFPNWSHTVFCGLQNETIMRECCSFISPNIKVILLEYDNITPSEYSQLLTSAKFWDQITGETILIHQEDSYIFHNSIEDFLT